MIARITGKVVFKDFKSVVLEAGGVGYRIFAKTETLDKLEENSEKPISLWTHLAVKEDALDLYGFENTQELRFFELLISISGIGPKSALGILGLGPVAALSAAIAKGDATYLTQVFGIGRKSASKIILELKEKIGVDGAEQATISSEDGEVLEALKALGFNPRDARGALQKINPETKGVSARVKEAMRALGTSRE